MLLAWTTWSSRVVGAAQPDQLVVVPVVLVVLEQGQAYLLRLELSTQSLLVLVVLVALRTMKIPA